CDDEGKAEREKLSRHPFIVHASLSPLPATGPCGNCQRTARLPSPTRWGVPSSTKRNAVLAVGASYCRHALPGGYGRCITTLSRYLVSCFTHMLIGFRFAMDMS